MIKINLAARKRAATPSAKSSGTANVKLSASQFRAIFAQLAEFPIKKIVLVLAFGAIANVLVSGYKDDLVKEQTVELEKIVSQKPRLEAEAAKMKGLQELQKSMEADEKLIRTKLEVIKKLIANRGGSAALLEELSRITPPNVWMSEFSLKDDEITFKGFSQDFGTISDFTKSVQNSAMFTGMNLKDTQIATDDQQRQVASFNLTARKR